MSQCRVQGTGYRVQGAGEQGTGAGSGAPEALEPMRDEGRQGAGYRVQWSLWSLWLEPRREDGRQGDPVQGAGRRAQGAGRRVQGAGYKVLTGSRAHPLTHPHVSVLVLVYLATHIPIARRPPKAYLSHMPPRCESSYRVCIYSCMYIFMYVYMHVCIYAYTHAAAL